MEKIIPLDGFYNKLPLLFGSYNRNLKLMCKIFRVNIVARDNLKVYGNQESIDKICDIVSALEKHMQQSGGLTPVEAEKIIFSFATVQELPAPKDSELFPVKPRTPGQEAYMQAIRDNEVIFAIGPSGTGKTFLAVAMAIEALHQSYVRRIVLVRPAVEAGERLGFLPGDLQEKVNPYLRPIYDALQSLLGYDRLKKYMEKDIIEIAPLAYMRGRTLENAFIILDEAQNTTMTQMKMFLTRLGLNSKMVITGDVTQMDLPREEKSGLLHARSLFVNIPGLCFFSLSRQDIVRHPIVQKIVEVYEKAELARNGDKPA